MQHLVRTSDGTLHAFVQSGSSMACGNARGANNYGLNWIYSVDNGQTWTCGGQLSPFYYLNDVFVASNLYSVSAKVDSSDNI
jgi:hypothetical protein